MHFLGSMFLYLGDLPAESAKVINAESFLGLFCPVAAYRTVFRNLASELTVTRGTS